MQLRDGSTAHLETKLDLIAIAPDLPHGAALVALVEHDPDYIVDKLHRPSGEPRHRLAARLRRHAVHGSEHLVGLKAAQHFVKAGEHLVVAAVADDSSRQNELGVTERLWGDVLHAGEAAAGAKAE